MIKTENIIVALDVESLAEARFYLDALSSEIKIFKVGSRLFVPYGREVVDLIKSYGCEVFLDLKFHDIPTQVSKTVEKIKDLGVKMFTVHSLGGKNMIEEARNTLDSFKAEQRPIMLAVTVLTSLNENDLLFLGFKNKINITVFKLAELALMSGASGLVCSVEEVAELKSKIARDFIAVVPGISMGEKNKDQSRVGSVKEAFERGADYIVIGRSILQAKDPLGLIMKEVNDER